MLNPKSRTTLNLTYSQLLRNYQYDPRAYKLMFALSSKVTNLENYITQKSNQIDFSIDKFEELYLSETPIERITKKTFFGGEEFILNDHVFCPRHETELILHELHNHSDISGKYIDICSGTEVIGIAYLKHNPHIPGTLLDISPYAIENIKANLKKHLVNAEVIQQDWLEHLNSNPDYQIISANFPYVGKNDPVQGIEHDPELALFANKQGWEHYEKMLSWMKLHSNWKLVILELNPFHSKIWSTINESNWNIQLIKDIRGLLRVVVITKESAQ